MSDTKSGKRKRKGEVTSSETSDPFSDVAFSFPESKLFRRLVEYERGLDHHLSIYRMSVRDALKSRTFRHQRRVIRLSISHTQTNQNSFYHFDSFDRASLLHPPSWILQFKGMVFETDKTGGYSLSSDSTSSSSSSSNPFYSSSSQSNKQKLSKCFKKVIIHLGEPLNEYIEWHPQLQVPVDGFEIKRSGQDDLLIRFFLYLDTNPPVYQLSEKLKQFMKVDSETRSRVLLSIYKYIKTNKLQSPTNRQTITCDAALRNLFSCSEFNFGDLLSLLTPHFLPPDPIELQYRLTLNQTHSHLSSLLSSPTLGESYEIETESDFANEDETFSAVDEMEKGITLLADEIHFQLDRLEKHREERQMMLKFAQDPLQEISSLIIDQFPDPKGSSHLELGELDPEHRPEYFFQPPTSEAISNYLSLPNKKA